MVPESHSAFLSAEQEEHYGNLLAQQRPNNAAYRGMSEFLCKRFGLKLM